MGKRKLTKRQMDRAQHIQATRRQRAQSISTDPLDQSLNLEQSGRLIAHYGTTVFVENQAGKLFRCDIRQNLGHLATGDLVIWQQVDEFTGVVTAFCPREKTLIRATKTGPKPLATNLTQMCVVIALKPKPQKTTLDRYLVLAQNAHIPVSIILNKMDLYDPAHHCALLEKLKYYENLGYPCFQVSSKTGQGLSELQYALNNQCSIMVGQSGVGKSSLLMNLVPTASARIQALSRLQETGKHTTTTTRLFHLPNSGDLIDTPGTNQLQLSHLCEHEIAQGFKEFQTYLGLCKYRDCKHQHERGCALQSAVELGAIGAFRLENFFKLITERQSKLLPNSKS